MFKVQGLEFEGLDVGLGFRCLRFRVLVFWCLGLGV